MGCLLVGALLAGPVLLAGCGALRRTADLLAPVASEAPVAPEAPEGALPVLVRVAACGATEGYVQELTRAYSQEVGDVHFDVSVVTPWLGLEMLAAGEADVAFITRRPGDDIATALPPTRTWQVTPLATDGLAVIVSSALPLRRINQADLGRLFSGQVLDWGELQAGSTTPEIVVQDVSSTSRGIFDEELIGGRSPTSAAVLVPDDRAAVSYVASHPNAVGYAAATALIPEVQVVDVEVARGARWVLPQGGYAARLEVVIVAPAAMMRDVYGLRKLATEPAGRRLLRAHFDGE